MIILDEPYASVPLLDWMEASAHPVLTNEFTEKLTAGGRALNLVDAAECAGVWKRGSASTRTPRMLWLGFSITWRIRRSLTPSACSRTRRPCAEKLAPLKSGPVPRNRRSRGAGSGERRRLAVAGGVEALRGVLLDGRLRY